MLLWYLQKAERWEGEGNYIIRDVALCRAEEGERDLLHRFLIKAVAVAVAAGHSRPAPRPSVSLKHMPSPADGGCWRRMRLVRSEGPCIQVLLPRKWVGLCNCKVELLMLYASVGWGDSSIGTVQPSWRLSHEGYKFSVDIIFPQFIRKT